MTDAERHENEDMEVTFTPSMNLNDLSRNEAALATQPMNTDPCTSATQSISTDPLSTAQGDPGQMGRSDTANLGSVGQYQYSSNDQPQTQSSTIPDQSPDFYHDGQTMSSINTSAQHSAMDATQDVASVETEGEDVCGWKNMEDYTPEDVIPHVHSNIEQSDSDMLHYNPHVVTQETLLPSPRATTGLFSAPPTNQDNLFDTPQTCTFEPAPDISPQDTEYDEVDKCVKVQGQKIQNGPINSAILSTSNDDDGIGKTKEKATEIFNSWERKPKVKSKKNYKSCQLDWAIYAVQHKRLNLSEASRVFQVPRKTLADKVKSMAGICPLMQGTCKAPKTSVNESAGGKFDQQTCENVTSSEHLQYTQTSTLHQTQPASVVSLPTERLLNRTEDNTNCGMYTNSYTHHTEYSSRNNAGNQAYVPPVCSSTSFTYRTNVNTYSHYPIASNFSMPNTDGYLTSTLLNNIPGMNSVPNQPNHYAANHEQALYTRHPVVQSNFSLNSFHNQNTQPQVLPVPAASESSFTAEHPPPSALSYQSLHPTSCHGFDMESSSNLHLLSNAASIINNGQRPSVCSSQHDLSTDNYEQRLNGVSDYQITAHNDKVPNEKDPNVSKAKKKKVPTATLR